ncbi:heme-binding protein [Mycolicibacterium pyrenivorans]|uniref:heme-binding protein n=1 Tax=Mycolicibacterium pyrenivorans TaxID=187102 RepID=UPI0021F2D801|nr:heme-binding protein [Mycolicibacterium pyrenivorans]MCV7152321.1 heme-binding protein [Mycolicibacterium pyrenivorans]
MNPSATTVRRGLFGMFAGGLLAFGSAAIIAPVANAQPAPAPAPGPNCSASAVAGTVSAATASEGAYLTANPQTNEALSAISSQPQPEAEVAYRAFFAQNPQVEEQLKAIHQPVSALQTECNLKLVPTPVAQAVWSGTEPAPVTPDTAEVPEGPVMEEIPAT